MPATKKGDKGGAGDQMGKKKRELEMDSPSSLQKELGIKYGRSTGWQRAGRITPTTPRINFSRRGNFLPGRHPKFHSEEGRSKLRAGPAGKP